MELNFDYFVVEFLHQPYVNIDKYVCVPYSWIEANAYGTTDRRVSVAYPAEPLSIMDQLVKNNRSPRKGWRSYCAVLRFGNDKFGVAKTYIYEKEKCEKIKLHKNRTKDAGPVSRGSKQRISSVSKFKKNLNKELKVKIHRNSLIEQNLRQQLTNNSINKHSRSTVIKTAKSVSKTSDSNKRIRNPDKSNLLSIKHQVNKNIKRSYPASKTPNKILSKSSNKLYRLTNYCIERNNQEVNKNCPHISSCDESLKHSVNKMRRSKNDDKDWEVTITQNARNVSQQYPNTSCLPSQVCDEQQKGTLLIVNEPYVYKDTHQKDIIVLKSSEVSTQRPHAKHHFDNVINQGPGIYHHLHGNQYLTVNKKANKCIKHSPKKINHNGCIKSSKQRKNANPLTIPSSETNITNFLNQSSQIQVISILNDKEYSSINKTYKVEDIPHQETISERNEDEINVDQSFNYQITSMMCPNKSEPCQNNITKSLHSTKDCVKFNNSNKNLECHSEIISHPSTSLSYSTELPNLLFAYQSPNCEKHSLPSLCEKKICMKSTNLINNAARIDCNNTNNGTKDVLNKASGCFLSRVTNPVYSENNILNESNPNPEVIRTIHFSEDHETDLLQNICNKEILMINRSGSNTVNDGGCFQNKEIEKSPVPSGYVVDDPRKVIIKKVININPLKTEVHSLNNTLTKNQIKSTQNDTMQISETINVTQYPSECNNSSRENPFACNISKNESLNKRAGHIGVSNTLRLKMNKKPEIQPTVSGIPAIITPVSKHGPIKESCIMFNQNTLVASNSSLKNLLIQRKDYGSETKISNPNEINNCDESNYDVVIPTKKTNEKLKNNLSKDEENLKKDNCNKSNVIVSSAKEKSNKLPKYKNEENSKTNKDGLNSKIDYKGEFSLPQDYNPNDSRWTLKHQKASPGVVELIPGSRVYINEVKLKLCISQAQNYNTLARKLFLEIFSLNALVACTLTGSKNNYGSQRPALDFMAKSAILKFIEEYGRAKGWSSMSTLTVLSSLRSKLHEMRKKISL